MINFKSLFPIVIGFSFWIYGNILLIKKLQNKTSEIREPKSSIEVSIDQDLKDKNKNEKKDLINVFKKKRSFHLLLSLKIPMKLSVAGVESHLKSSISFMHICIAKNAYLC